MNPGQISAELARFPARLREATLGFDNDTARRRSSTGNWSVIELVCHVRDYMEIFNSRVVRALNEDDPAVLAYDNEDLSSNREYMSQDLGQVVAAAVRLRENTVAIMAGMNAAAWQRTLEHPTWGQKTLEWMLNRCDEHELEHLEDLALRRREFLQDGPLTPPAGPATGR